MATESVKNAAFDDYSVIWRLFGERTLANVCIILMLTATIESMAIGVYLKTLFRHDGSNT